MNKQTANRLTLRLGKCACVLAGVVTGPGRPTGTIHVAPMKHRTMASLLSFFIHGITKSFIIRHGLNAG
jgi:hypothetical protein